MHKGHMKIAARDHPQDGGSYPHMVGAGVQPDNDDPNVSDTGATRKLRGQSI